MSNSEIERDELPIEPHEDLSPQTNGSDKIEEIVEPSKPVLTEEELAKVHISFIFFLVCLLTWSF